MTGPTPSRRPKQHRRSSSHRSRSASPQRAAANRRKQTTANDSVDTSDTSNILGSVTTAAATTATGTSADRIAAEISLRDLAIRERDVALRERETEARLKIEKRGLMYSSPLLIALISTVLGTAIGAGLQGYSDSRLERLKFEFSLVQGAFENEDREEAAKQLQFIANSGVVVNMDTEKLRSLAETPDQIPKAPFRVLTFPEDGKAYYTEAMRVFETILSESEEPILSESETTAGRSKLVEDAAVREAPESSAAILFNLKKGEEVSILSIELEEGVDLWFQIESDNNEGAGWIEGSSLETRSPAEIIPGSVRRVSPAD